MDLKHLSLGKRRALLVLCIVICVACLPSAGRVNNQWVMAVCGVGLVGSIIRLFRLRNAGHSREEPKSEQGGGAVRS